MKNYHVLILIFLSFNLYSQQTDILLIGASHNYSNSPQQDLSSVYQRIKDFNPDAFFGEFVSKEDERNLMDYWCKEANLRRLENLRNNRYIQSEHLPKVIDSLKNLILENPEDFISRTDLAHAYYLDQDVSNAHYQYWLVYDHLKMNPDEQLEKYVNNLLDPESDVSARSMKRLITSEYAVIAFPMMKELKFEELLSMDSQDYDLNWSASALAFHNKFEVFKNDIASAYAEELKQLLKKREEGFKSYFQKEKTSINLTEWLNTDQASAILHAGDFYFSSLYKMEGFPQEEMLSQIHWWTMRNKEMCENIVEQAKKMNYKKVVVIVGANHRKLMQEILDAMPDVRVKNLNAL